MSFLEFIIYFKGNPYKKINRISLIAAKKFTFIFHDLNYSVNNHYRAIRFAPGR